jgi:hypothetical protein
LRTAPYILRYHWYLKKKKVFSLKSEKTITSRLFYRMSFKTGLNPKRVFCECPFKKRLDFIFVSSSGTTQNGRCHYEVISRVSQKKNR